MTTFENIKKTAQGRGLNLKTVATKAGLSENAIYSWRNKNPRTESLQAVADVLGVSVDYLLGNTDEMHPKQADTTNTSIDLREVSDDERYELISAGGKPISDEDWAIIKAVLAKYPRKEN